jgi:hypothetical protein
VSRLSAAIGTTGFIEAKTDCHSCVVRAWRIAQNARVPSHAVAVILWPLVVCNIRDLSDDVVEADLLFVSDRCSGQNGAWKMSV